MLKRKGSIQEKNARYQNLIKFGGRQSFGERKGLLWEQWPRFSFLAATSQRFLQEFTPSQDCPSARETANDEKSLMRLARRKRESKCDSAVWCEQRLCFDVLIIVLLLTVRLINLGQSRSRAQCFAGTIKAEASDSTALRVFRLSVTFPDCPQISSVMQISFESGL